MLKKFLVRIRNPKVISAVVSGILLILVNAGIIDTHLSDNIMKAVNTVLGVVVGLGIFSNPESHIQPDVEIPIVDEGAQPQPQPESQPAEQPKA